MISASINDKILDQMRLNNQHDAVWKWNGEMPSTMIGGTGNGGAPSLLLGVK